MRSPIDGHVSRALITAGNLVSSADVLTTVVSDDPIYAYFDTDGTARVTQKAGIKKASWIIDKGTICHDLSVERKCYTVTKKGADTIQLQSTDRKWTPTYRMVAGNPEKL